MQYTLKNGARLVIREAETTNAAALLAYTKKVAGESDNLIFGPDDITQSVTEEADYIASMRAPKNCLLIGTIDGNLVASAEIKGNEIPRIAHGADLSITVAKDYWSCGVGTKLISTLIERAKARDITQLRLMVNVRNQSAVALYKRFGFVTTGCGKGYIKINDVFEDAFLMDLYMK